MEATKILIIEDEFIVAEDISMQLEQAGYHISGIFDNGEDAIASLAADTPDIILIDINILGAIDGIETAGRISEIIRVPLIFVTAYSGPSYFERVKKVKPHAYIIKPFNFLNLIAAIELALFNFQRNLHMNNPENSKLPYPDHPVRNYLVNDHIFLNRGTRFDKVNLNDILFLEANGSYCNVITKDGKYILSHNLQNVLQNIKNTGIIRTHRSYAININCVTSYTKSSLIINDFNIPMSEQYKETVMSRINIL